jgi:hypothetical protein
MENKYFLEVDRHGFYNLFVNEGTWPIASTNPLLKKDLDISKDATFVAKMKVGKQIKVKIEELDESILVYEKA